MWIGKWHMKPVPFAFIQSGRVVIRRTRESGQAAGTVARLGSYYQGGVSHKVTGFIETSTNRAHLFIDLMPMRDHQIL